MDILEEDGRQKKEMREEYRKMREEIELMRERWRVSELELEVARKRVEWLEGEVDKTKSNGGGDGEVREGIGEVREGSRRWREMEKGVEDCVHRLENRPVQCWKCLGFGHIRGRCREDDVVAPSPGCCFRCATPGHVAVRCSAPPPMLLGVPSSGLANGAPHGWPAV